MLVTFVVVLLLLTWRVMDLLVLAFGAVVVAATLRVLCGALERRMRIPRRWSLTAALLLIISSLAIGISAIGDPLAEQFQRLREGLPAALRALMHWLESQRAGAFLLEYLGTLKDDSGPWAQRLAGIAGTTFGALGTASLMLLMGIYLAASPSLYRAGVVRLVPPRLRGRASDALDASGHALSRWLLGQSVSMLFVGCATALGLWLLGVPLAFAVGIINGLMAFIPFFGAIAGGLLAVLLAFIDGPQTALYVVILAVAIQQVEGHLLMPLVQRWAVNLPPVLGLAAAVLFGVLFGLMGVLLATPMMVVLMVLVQKLYVEGILEQETVPAEDQSRMS